MVAAFNQAAQRAFAEATPQPPWEAPCWWEPWICGKISCFHPGGAGSALEPLKDI